MMVANDDNHFVRTALSSPQGLPLQVQVKRVCVRHVMWLVWGVEACGHTVLISHHNTHLPLILQHYTLPHLIYHHTTHTHFLTIMLYQNFLHLHLTPVSPHPDLSLPLSHNLPSLPHHSPSLPLAGLLSHNPYKTFQHLYQALKSKSE